MIEMCITMGEKTPNFIFKNQKVVLKPMTIAEMGKYCVQKSTKVLETKKNSLHILTKKRFQQLNQDIYEKFHAFNLPRSSFSKPGGVDGDKWQPPFKVYHK